MKIATKPRQKSATKAPQFKDLVDPRIKRVSRMVAVSLTLFDERAMWLLAAVIRGRLTPQQRVFLAMAALWGLSDEEYQIVIDGLGRR